MHYRLTLLGIFLLLAAACDEGEGFETNVEKTVEVGFELNINEIVNNNGAIDFSSNQNIFSNEFSEYIGKVEGIEVHRVDVKITDIDETAIQLQPSFSLLDFDIRSLGSNAQNLNFFELEDFPFTNTESISLYKEDSVQSAEINAAVDFIRTQQLLNETIIWDISGGLEGIPPDKEFSIRLYIDFTVTVVLR